MMQEHFFNIDAIDMTSKRILYVSVAYLHKQYTWKQIIP